MAYWDILAGIDEGIKEHQKRSIEEVKKQSEAQRDKAQTILESMIEGKIRPAGEGEQADVYGPGERIEPQGMGQRLMEGFGLKTPEYGQGQGYSVVPEAPQEYKPTTLQELLNVEREKAGIKEEASERERAMKQYEDVTGKAAGEGFSLTAVGETPQERLKSALRLYAGRPQEEKVKTPSWGQEQKVASIRSGLQRGEVVIGREFGEPTKYTVSTIEDAHRAIQDAGLAPALFAEELKRYEEVVVQDKRGQQFMVPRWQLEDAIAQGYAEVK